jgi:phytoene synthase
MTSPIHYDVTSIGPGSSRYYSLLFLDEEHRQAATAMEALRAELASIGVVTSEPAVAQTKLNWWRSEIDNLFQDTPQHPLTHALRPIVKQYNLPKEQFEEMLDGRDMDLTINRYDTFSELALYLHRNAGVGSQMASEIFGYTHRQTMKYAHALGLATQLSEIIFNLHGDIKRDRIYVPLDELDRFAVPVDELRQGQHSDRLVSLLEFQAQRARDHFTRAQELLSDADRYAQRSGLILARLYQLTLDEIAADGFRVLEHRVALTPLRKFWLAWRTHQQEKRRHRKYVRENRLSNV